MAANRLTEVATEVVTSEGSNGAITLLAVEVVVPNTNAPDPPFPCTFSIQKLILSVKESNIPVRGRNR